MDVISILRKKGASMEHRDNQGTTPLLKAIINDRKDIVEMLLQVCINVALSFYHSCNY